MGFRKKLLMQVLRILIKRANAYIFVAEWVAVSSKRNGAITRGDGYRENQNCRLEVSICLTSSPRPSRL